MLKNIQIGQTVFFEDRTIPERILSGIVTDIQQETLSSSPLRVHTEVDIEYCVPECNSRRKIKTRRTASSIFGTEADCLLQIHIDKGVVDVKNLYRREIHSVKDLMKFIFSHEISCDNNAATIVAREKAAELFGFDLTELMPVIEV